MKDQFCLKFVLLCFLLLPDTSFADAQAPESSVPGLLESKPGCRVWIENVQAEPEIKKSDECVEVYASKTDTLDKYYPGKFLLYVGGIKDGKFEGPGIVKFSDSRILSGEFHGGNINGVVEYIIHNGLHYKGEWSGNAEEGKGVATFPSGNHYDGMWHNGQMDGYGVMTSPSGTVHEGVFRDGRPNGHGVTFKPDGYRIEGEWVDGVLNGHGAYSSVHGAHYDGDFKNGKLEGSGKYTNNEGDTYQGDWHNGVPNGQGTVTRKGGVFAGEWQNGCLFLNKGFIAVIVDPKSCEKSSD